MLFQALPTLQLEIIDATVKEFFATNHIMSEDGFPSLTEEDLPARDDVKTDSYWKRVLFRRTTSTVITGCCQFRVLPNTLYNLILQQSRVSSLGLSLGPPMLTATSKIAYSVKTVASVTLNPFSGLTSDFKDWPDSVANVYGICGHQFF